MANEEVRLDIRVQGRREASRDLRGTADDVRDVGGAADDAGSAFSRLDRLSSRTFGRVGSAAKAGLGAVGAAAAAVTVAGGAAAVGLYKTGVQIDALGKKSKTVFGSQIGMVNSWAAANAAAMGLTRSQAVGLAAGFGDLLIPMGFSRREAAKMSTDVIGLSGALAEWSGGQKSAAEVAEVLQAAMLGETDGLKGLGIAISAADVEAALAAKGQSKLTGAAMQQAQALAIQQLILAKSVDAQKAYASGADSPIRRQAELKAGALELRDTFAKALLPASNAVVGGLLPLAEKALPAVERGIKSASRAVTNLTTQIPNLWGAMRDGDTYGMAEVLDNILGNSGTKIEPIYNGLEQLRGIGEDLSAVLRDGLAPAVMDVATAISPSWLTPLGLARAALGFLSDHTTTARIVLTGLVGALLAVKVATLAGTVATKAYRAAQLVATAAVAAHKVATGQLTVAEVRQTAAGRAATAGALVGKVATLGWAAATTVAAGAARLAGAAIRFMLGPIGLVLLAVGGLAVVIYKNWDGIKAATGRVRDFIVTAFNTVVGFITGLPGRIASVASGMFDSIKGAFLGAVNWVIRTWNDLSLTLGGQRVNLPFGQGFDIPSVTLSTPNISEIQGYAKGGTPPVNQPFLVGEQGPELMQIGGRSFVTPADLTEQALRSSMRVLRAPTMTMPADEDGPRQGAGAPAPAVTRRDPTIIQLVVDRKVLAEAAVDGIDDRRARE